MQALPTDTRPPVAISYKRYSSPEQGKGDSLRRQSALEEAWLKRNPTIPPDKSGLSGADEGKSAYHGKNLDDTAVLGRFLQAVQSGQVPQGSYLLIENLDRLSRKNPWESVPLLCSIVNAGVRVVQLVPEIVFEKNNPLQLMMASVELMRGHSESGGKSSRNKANLDGMRERARNKMNQLPRRKDGLVTKAVTAQLPGWVRIGEDGGLEEVPGRADAVRLIFNLAVEGYGASSVVKKLKADKVPAFGDREESYRDDSNKVHHRAVKGERYGCGDWRVSYVRRILKSRRVLGEWQPRDLKGNKLGEPIKGYFPRVVSDEDFVRAQAAVAGRKQPQGRIGEGVASVFGGLLRNARDGGSYYVAQTSAKGVTYRRLLNRSSVEGASKAVTFDYPVLERALLTCLDEIDVNELLGKPRNLTAEAAALGAELDEVKARLVSLKAQLATCLPAALPILSEQIGKDATRQDDLVRRLEAVEQEKALPIQETWTECKGLIAFLDDAQGEELTDRRLRLRSTIRRIVQSVWVLVVRRGRDRAAAVQVRFAGGGQREYAVWYSPDHRNARTARPGWYRVASVRSAFGHFDPGSDAAIGVAPFDLADPAGVQRAEDLLSVSDDGLLSSVFDGAEARPLP
jgi:DNA invertase Pin-like site-specific DNA recombinase